MKSAQSRLSALPSPTPTRSTGEMPEMPQEPSSAPMAQCPSFQAAEPSLLRSPRMQCSTICSSVQPAYSPVNRYSAQAPEASEKRSASRGALSYAARLPSPLATVPPALCQPLQVFWPALLEPKPVYRSPQRLGLVVVEVRVVVFSAVAPATSARRSNSPHWARSAANQSCPRYSTRPGPCATSRTQAWDPGRVTYGARAPAGTESRRTVQTALRVSSCAGPPQRSSQEPASNSLRQELQGRLPSARLQPKSEFRKRRAPPQPHTTNLPPVPIH
mmetsp:Transcript_73634/g.203261  ORF Transcript_73634/g.203261 Transcript_73634/m.203261 type:complete len:274 (-) Transcript_73634:381-1202(-)